MNRAAAIQSVALHLMEYYTSSTQVVKFLNNKPSRNSLTYIRNTIDYFNRGGREVAVFIAGEEVR